MPPVARDSRGNTLPQTRRAWNRIPEGGLFTEEEGAEEARRLAGARAIFVSVLRPTDSPIPAARFITFVAARVLCRIIPGRRSRNLAVFFSLVSWPSKN